MSKTSDHQVPIQRLKDIGDPLVREQVTLGVQITLEGNLAHLRSIKDTELNWLQMFAILTLPAIGYLMGVGDDNPVLGWPIIPVFVLYLLLTGWLQYVLLRERISYYSVLRSVVRSQNLLGLFDIDYLSPHFADSPFPREFGPQPEENGTQPQSSFLRRQIYTVMLYVGFLLAAAFRACSASSRLLPITAVIVAALCLALDLVWLRYIFDWDETMLKAHTAREKDLAGSDPTWFSSGQKSETGSQQ